MEIEKESIDQNEALQTQQMTPMVRQYKEIKSRHRDKILLFRLGDFYEMFDEDAKEAARILNIALTSRNETPMCGFPYHAANQYILKLLNAGKKIAVCEQLEDPSKAKGIVKRDIVSIVTPGTVTDDNFIVRKQNNFLCCLFGNGPDLAVSFVDISTGDFYAVASAWFSDASEKYRLLQDEITRFQPSEIIYNQKLGEQPGALNEIKRSGTLSGSFPDWYFDGEFLKNEKKAVFPEAVSKDAVLHKSVLGALHYLYETQGVGASGFFNHLGSVVSNIQVLNRESYMEMDDFTIRNLELVRNMQDGSRKFTLLEVLDSTVTPMGGRLLRRWVLMPLSDKKKIYERQNFTEEFFEDTILTAKVREVLQKISDIERLALRIAIKKAIPRDLPALADSLQRSRELKTMLADKKGLADLSMRIVEMDDVVTLIRNSIQDEPSTVFNGDVIREGYHEELDKLRKMMREGKDWILKLQNDERERTGISSLKVKYNNVFGYFIEISKANLDGVPSHYIRKQSLTNAERYTIPELSEYETQISSASEKVEKLEEEIFNGIVEEISKHTADLQNVANAIALIDVYSNYALVAKENDYVKPSVDDGISMELRDGRHPVVEKHIGRNLFVPNDTALDEDENRIIVLTGPNMAGKSTYLRQNALVVIMAQIGSYVPAKKASIGIVDKIFTRIGASDNLSQGQSTFLVEMQEAANILRNATAKSLIIMDELGRGTSTYDGLSIAWAVIEYLHEHKEKGGKTLFATHYHELTKLGEKKGIQNFNIAVREYKDELVFLRKVISGPADRSYGIYVAKLAGIHPEIIDRAKIILKTLEKEGSVAKNRIEAVFDRDYRKGAKQSADRSDMELFPDDMSHALTERIKNLNLDTMTPLEAMTFLAEIKKQIKE